MICTLENCGHGNYIFFLLEIHVKGLELFVYTKRNVYNELYIPVSYLHIPTCQYDTGFRYCIDK